jgi:hypothetical protein
MINCAQLRRRVRNALRTGRMEAEGLMNRRDDDDEMVVLEVKAGEAALLFTLDGLQAILPEDTGDTGAADQPWHLRVVERAMMLIRDYALEQQLLHKAEQVTEHGKDCPACKVETLLAIAKHQLTGEA